MLIYRIFQTTEVVADRNLDFSRPLGITHHRNDSIISLESCESTSEARLMWRITQLSLNYGQIEDVPSSSTGEGIYFNFLSMFESQFRHKQRRLLRVVSILESRLFLGHRNSIGLLKVSLHQRRREAQAMRLFVPVIIKPLGLVVVMLSCFLSPIDTQPSNAVLSATTGTVEVANFI